MRSLFEKKPLVVLFAILALGALTVLSVSLRTVTFEEARPVSWEDSSSSPSSFFGGGESARPLGVSRKMQISLFISLLLLAGLVSLLISAEARKRFLRLVLNMMLLYWVLSYVTKKYPDMLTIFDSIAAVEAAPPVEGEILDVPVAVFTPPEISPLLSYAISVGIMLIGLFSAWYLYRMWMKLRPSGNNTLTVMAQIARRSLRELSSGANSTDVILNCYQRMSEVVADTKSLHREMYMTPSEFAVRLEHSGLPGNAVRRLTRLFESVRYGGNKAGPKETNEAVACLTDILHYCGEST